MLSYQRESHWRSARYAFGISGFPAARSASATWKPTIAMAIPNGTARALLWGCSIPSLARYSSRVPGEDRGVQRNFVSVSTAARPFHALKEHNVGAPETATIPRDDRF